MSDKSIEDKIREIVRDELGKRNPAPPSLPSSPWPPGHENRCSVCNIDWGNGAFSYHCVNPKCPAGIRAQ